MIFIASDHRGFELKQQLYQRLVDEGFKITDLGNDHLDPNDDYPDFALGVAKAVVADPQNRGIILCGSGVGVDIVANKIPGIRSALVFDVPRSKQSREHEDVNIISLPADILDEELSWEMVKTFLNTPFSSDERHVRRLQKVKEVEKEYEK